MIHVGIGTSAGDCRVRRVEILVKDAAFAPMTSSLFARKGYAAPSVIAPPRETSPKDVLAGDPAQLHAAPAVFATPTATYEPAILAAPPTQTASIADCAAATPAPSHSIGAEPMPDTGAIPDFEALDMATVKKDRVLRRAIDAYFGRAPY